jgi:hypothetical protein
VYFDGDADLNTPATTRSGILDGVGVAHRLGDGAPALAGLGPQVPLLPAERLVLFGFDPVMLEPAETERLRRSGLATWPVNKIAGRPAEAAAEALAVLERRADPLLVHFDVDAIDSTELPLANYPHFNLGQSFDSAMTCSPPSAHIPGSPGWSSPRSTPITTPTAPCSPASSTVSSPRWPAPRKLISVAAVPPDHVVTSARTGRRSTLPAMRGAAHRSPRSGTAHAVTLATRLPSISKAARRASCASKVCCVASSARWCRVPVAARIPP